MHFCGAINALTSDQSVCLGCELSWQVSRHLIWPFFNQERTESMEGLIVRNATNLVKSACLLTLGDTWRSDPSLVGFPNSVKHFVFSVDELRTLLESYKKLYPGQKVEVTSNIENGVFITLQISFYIVRSSRSVTFITLTFSSLEQRILLICLVIVL